MAEILERIVKKLNRIKEADKVRSKAKEAAVENIVFINGKKKSPTKRQKVYCTDDNADKEGNGVNKNILSLFTFGNQGNQIDNQTAQNITHAFRKISEERRLIHSCSYKAGAVCNNQQEN